MPWKQAKADIGLAALQKKTALRKGKQSYDR